MKTGIVNRLKGLIWSLTQADACAIKRLKENYIFLKLNHCAISKTTNVPGFIAGRGCGFSAVAGGVSPYSAVGK